MAKAHSPRNTTSMNTEGGDTVTIPWAISSVVYLRFLTGLVTKYCNCYEKIEDNCHEKTEDQSIIK